MFICSYSNFNLFIKKLQTQSYFVYGNISADESAHEKELGFSGYVRCSNGVELTVQILPFDVVKRKLKWGEKNMLTTERLVLKPYDDNDEERMVELLTNETIKETYMIPDFGSREEAVSMFKKLQQYSRSNEHYEFGIYKQNELIGFLNDVSIELDSIEIGYVIHPDYHNNGYASEMLSSVIEDLFQRRFYMVIAGAFETNTASCRVMEKCGMKRIEKETDIFYHNKQQHCIYYSITANRTDSVRG